MFVAAGCGSTGTATPTTSTATSTGTPAAPTATPSAVASANGVDITDPKYASSITPAAKTGGTVVVSDWQSPDFVNPYYYDAEVDVESFGMAFDSMVVVTQNLGYIPNLASEVPTTTNGDVVVNGTAMDLTWKLKPNMKWSDGSPINCDDVIATWKWIMDPAQTGLAAGTVGWDQITGIDGAGTTTCVVHFKTVFEGYLGLWAPLLPAKYIATIPVKDAATKLYPLADPAQGVYSGPYIPTSYQTDAQVTFAANPNWATIGLGSNLHAPYLDKVIFKLYGGDPTLMIKGFTAGEIDLGQDLQNADIPSLTGVPTNEQVIHDALTYELHAYNNASFQKKFGADWQTVIQAVKLATDRQAIAAGPLQGNVTVTNNFISPLTWYYKDEGGDTAAHPDQATAMLAAAGFTKGSDGILAKNGQKIELTYCTTTAQVRVDTLKLVASELNAIGIKADVTPVKSSILFGAYNGTPATTQCNLLHGNYDVGEHAYSSPLDPFGGYAEYVSTQNPDIAPHNGANETRVNIPALDAAYKAVASTVDLTAIKTAMDTVQDLYASSSNTYELPLFLRKDVWLTDGKIQNFTGNPTSESGDWNVGDWWLQQ
jgi:peptide/nickel transport system substrate-binding protein